MIVYAVAADVSIIRMFIAGILPGAMLLCLFSGYIVIWALLNPHKTPKASLTMSLGQRIKASGNLIPVLLLIAFVFSAMVSGFATANEASAFGVLGALCIAGFGGSFAAPIASLMIEKMLNKSIDPSRAWLEQRMKETNLMDGTP